MIVDMYRIELTAATSGYTLTDQVMTKLHHGQLYLRYLTMKGDVRRTLTNVYINVPNDRHSLPAHPTLQDVVELALRRQHPVMQYIAEQNGIVVEGYFELNSLAQGLACIEYGPDGMAKRLLL